MVGEWELPPNLREQAVEEEKLAAPQDQELWKPQTYQQQPGGSENLFSMGAAQMPAAPV